MNTTNTSNNYHWICPNCNEKVDFIKEMQDLFNPDENNKAEFNPNGGIYFHTIECKCGKHWIISMSGMKDGFSE